MTTTIRTTIKNRYPDGPADDEGEAHDDDGSTEVDLRLDDPPDAVDEDDPVVDDDDEPAATATADPPGRAGRRAPAARSNATCSNATCSNATCSNATCSNATCSTPPRSTPPAPTPPAAQRHLLQRHLLQRHLLQRHLLQRRRRADCACRRRPNSVSGEPLTDLVPDDAEEEHDAGRTASPSLYHKLHQIWRRANDPPPPARGFARRCRGASRRSVGRRQDHPRQLPRPGARPASEQRAGRRSFSASASRGATPAPPSSRIRRRTGRAGEQLGEGRRTHAAMDRNGFDAWRSGVSRRPLVDILQRSARAAGLDPKEKATRPRSPPGRTSPLGRLCRATAPSQVEHWAEALRGAACAVERGSPASETARRPAGLRGSRPRRGSARRAAPDPVAPDPVG